MDAGMETLLSKRRRELKEARRQAALRKVGRAARALYESGAKEVYAFGSVLHPSKFDEQSDVDIAVAGISEGRRYSIIKIIEDIFGDVSFDLVFLEDDIRPEVRERILKGGVLWKR